MVIELALDRGKISATPLAGDPSPVTQRICEMELERIEGASIDPLFDVAIAFAGELHLHPEIASKAERGYALARGVPCCPVKGFGVPLSRGMAPVEAFRRIASACLAQLQRNEAGAIAGEDPEFIHQARVAIRRLRSAFQVFAPVLSADFVATYSPRWKELACQLGGARDWDVFLAETLSPLELAFPGNPDLAKLRSLATERRLAAGNHAAKALTQPEYSQLLLAFSAALMRETPPTIALPGAGSTEGKLHQFAARRLRRRWVRIESLLHGLGHMEAERCHCLRIEFKKLRYALEFFAPILPGKRLTRYLSILARIQDLLGTLNDQATALRFVRTLHPDNPPDSLLGGWLAGRTQLLLSTLASELKLSAASRKPW